MARGTKVTVKCRSGGCGTRSVTRRAGSGALRFGTFRRSLRAGAVIEVLVMRPGAVGRYVRFRVRTGAAPLRTDLCLSSRGRRQRCL